jgi:hypothetical protein
MRIDLPCLVWHELCAPIQPILKSIAESLAPDSCPTMCAQLRVVGEGDDAVMQMAATDLYVTIHTETGPVGPQIADLDHDLHLIPARLTKILGRVSDIDVRGVLTLDEGPAQKASVEYADGWWQQEAIPAPDGELIDLWELWDRHHTDGGQVSRLTIAAREIAILGDAAMATGISDYPVIRLSGFANGPDAPVTWRSAAGIHGLIMPATIHEEVSE